MVFLTHIGTEGAGSNSRKQRQMFGIGQGTADIYGDRVMRAILKLRPTYCTWLDKEERKKLLRKAKKKTGFPNVVGIADGTLFHLRLNQKLKMLLTTKRKKTHLHFDHHDHL